jgi:hypothetical protein
METIIGPFLVRKVNPDAEIKLPVGQMHAGNDFEISIEIPLLGTKFPPLQVELTFFVERLFRLLLETVVFGNSLSSECFETDMPSCSAKLNKNDTLTFSFGDRTDQTSYNALALLQQVFQLADKEIAPIVSRGTLSEQLQSALLAPRIGIAIGVRPIALRFPENL